MHARVAQLTDTHITAEGSTYFGTDTAAYLKRALTALHALDPQPDYIVVTGDLANFGTRAEYERFRDLMAGTHLPYFVIPGNHDDRDRMRETLPTRCYGDSRDARVRYTVEEFPVRLVGIDLNSKRPWPGARTDPETLGWLDRTLAAMPQQPTIIAVHQPPFRTGLHYLDLGGFIGRTKLRALVDRHPHVRAVISGHIHCARSAVWKRALASSSPSTAPQIIPLVLMEGRILGVSHERPGFAIHDLHADASYVRTEFRLDDAGTYAAVATRRDSSS